MLPISDYDYALPPELIAQTPPPARGDSRLLHLDNAGQTHDLAFSGLPSLLRPGDLLVFNDTRVIKARLAGHKATGGKIEVLIERITGPDRALAHVRASKSPAAGMRLRLAGAFDVSVLGREGELFDLQFPGDVLGLLDTHGATPLPPYITHAAGVQDEERYQTVYARSPGAVAAPTAGLHFDAAMLERLAAMGVERAFVTLHVGAGTFQPVRVADITEHVMHAEWYTVPEATIAAIEQARARGSRVIAVGTTSLRALESAARPVDQIEPACGPTPSATAPMARSTPSSASASASSSAPLPAQAPPFPARRAPLERKQGDTRLFIAPGYRFGVIDALITNFHLPQSTLLMLVSALAGVQPIRSAYAHAVARRYRFFSYGDAMFIESQASL